MSQADVDAACPTCSALGDFLEIENAQAPADWDTSQSFPPEVQSLQIPNESLAPYFGFGSERLLKCPDCGTYYWYRQWAPGGSEDVLHTYIHESVRRLSYLEAHVALHDALDQAHRRALEYGGVFATEIVVTALRDNPQLVFDMERLVKLCKRVADGAAS